MRDKKLTVVGKLPSSKELLGFKFYFPSHESARSPHLLLALSAYSKSSAHSLKNVFLSLLSPSQKWPPFLLKNLPFPSCSALFSQAPKTFLAAPSHSPTILSSFPLPQLSRFPTVLACPPPPQASPQRSLNPLLTCHRLVPPS